MRRVLAIALLILGLAIVLSRGGPITYYEGPVPPPPGVRP
jgi:hypothetical protein